MEKDTGLNRNRFERNCFRFIVLYTLLFISTCPFGFNLLPDFAKGLNPFFESLSKFTGDHVFNIRGSYEYRIISDSTGFYLHSFNMIFIALTGVLILYLWDKQGRYEARVQYWFLAVVRYYLALVLLIYGFSKVFKYQFYFPEPNTLYTPLGALYRDILFWSTIGSSYSYSVFAGVIEIVPAVLLLFRRTYLAGALIAFAVLLNVTMINFSFDVSVKLFSLFLLFLTVVLITPDAKRIFTFFFGKAPDNVLGQFKNGSHPRGLLYLICKVFVITILFAESTCIYFRAGNFNGDKRKRHSLVGAYQVEGMIKGNDTLRPDSYPWKRVFFHSGQYLVIQKMNDSFDDFKYEMVAGTTRMKIDHQDIEIKKINVNELMLKGSLQSERIEVLLKKINTDSLPLLEKGFHWTIDG